MKKIISLLLLGCLLSGCSIFRTHKMDIEQGNVISQEDVNHLHTGMSESQVKDIMGQPILTNVFSPNRIDYVYTLQKGYEKRIEKRVICVFRNGRLVDIQQS